MARRNRFHQLLSDLYIHAIEFIGVLLFFGALLTILALFSYCSEDPSLNTAIDGAASNLLGRPGSYYADFMFQFLGWNAYLVSGLFLSFAYQLIQYHTIHLFRFFCGLIALICSCIIGEIVHISNPGVIGKFLLDFCLMLTHNKWIILSVIGLLFACSILLATRFTWSTISDISRAISALWPDKTDDVLDVVSENEESTPLGFVDTILNATKKAEKQSKPKKSKSTQCNSDGFMLPPLDLLKSAPNSSSRLSESELQQRSQNLLQVLNDFGIEGEITGVSPGPVVTLYELRPAAGIKSSRVIGLANDIARYMSAVSARVSVIPGRNALGIELPNVKRETVYLREILEADVYVKTSSVLPVTLGKDISGEAIVTDLARMPHLLIAGTTGSGKSVGINAMIVSLLYRLTPSQCRFIMIDPKMLELSVYDDIPHLLTPVVTDPHKAVTALKWAVREMESRYVAMSKLGVRNIDNYNAKLSAMKNAGESVTRRVHTGFDPDTGAPIYETQVLQMDLLPYIVIIVDEMADLMLVAGKEIEIAVQRLAQMARAAGIHLIMATQRPSVDVITGTIKANFPTRISFQVSSKIDSRTILNEQGAEQLLGHGDMLYLASGGRMVRIHGPFVSDAEVEKVAEHLKSQGEPHYITDILEDDNESLSEAENSDGKDGGDPLYNEAVSLILREGKASTSFLQRHMKIGYNRAARIIDMMEAAGIVSPANHVGKREILGK